MQLILINDSFSYNNELLGCYNIYKLSSAYCCKLIKSLLYKPQVNVTMQIHFGHVYLSFTWKHLQGKGSHQLCWRLKKNNCHLFLYHSKKRYDTTIQLEIYFNAPLNDFITVLEKYIQIYFKAISLQLAICYTILTDVMTHSAAKIIEILFFRLSSSFLLV